MSLQNEMRILIIILIFRPLHIAARSGLVKVVQELVNRGADLGVRDADGMYVTLYRNKPFTHFPPL